MILAGSAKGSQPPVAKESAEGEIRSALCDLEKRDFETAQKRIRAVLATDPENIYAQKILLGILDAAIKFGDSSDQNKARIRTAIEAYDQASKRSAFTAAEKNDLDRYVILLYGLLGKEEVISELQKREADSNRTAPLRSEFYAALAGKSWECSYLITGDKPALEKAEIEKARSCATRGLDYADRAINFNASNDAAWSYKASLLNEASKLAGFENNQAQKILLQGQFTEAQKRSTELANERRAAEEKEWERSLNAVREKVSSQAEAEISETKELTEYRAETSLDEAVKQVFRTVNLELGSLVAPVPMPIPEEKPQGSAGSTVQVERPPIQKGCFREVDGPEQIQEKRDWKQFSPDGDLTVDLPDNVCERGGGFVAASEGVMYTIASMERPKISVSAEIVERVLNISAITFVKFRSRNWVDGGAANAFEIKLLLKENLNGEPRRVYGYQLRSCAERKENVLITQATKAHYYTIDISGANESDPRVQRFIKSLKF